jgi:hypothetical protein
MRITASLIAFVFLGVATAGVVPDIARRDSNGGKGGHSASMSGVHPSGSPTGAVVDSTPSGIYSHSAAPRRAEPTGSHSLPSGSPTGASDHPAPSAGSPSHSAAHRRGQPTGGQSHSPSHSASASDGNSMHPSQPSGALQLEHSGSPSDASVQPKPTASHA